MRAGEGCNSKAKFFDHDLSTWTEAFETSNSISAVGGGVAGAILRTLIVVCTFYNLTFSVCYWDVALKKFEFNFDSVGVKITK